VETGRELFTFKHRGPVKGVAWQEGDQGFATCSDPFGTEVPAAIHFYSLAANPSEQSEAPRLTVSDPEAPRVKTTKIAWLPLNKALVAANEKGFMSLIDPLTGETNARWQAHESEITSITFNKEKSLCLTSSKDRTAKLWDCGISLSSKDAPPEGSKMSPFKLLRTYNADAPLNGAALSPFREHIVAGGGQDAMSVTTTGADAGKFESRFYHMVFGNELGRVKGHFGPINTLAFNPDGRSFASGGEDGYVRLHPLDEEYDRLGEEDDNDLDDAGLAAALADGTLERLEAEEEEAKRKAELQEAATKAALAAK
jgi:translation initiation factor 3 subunit I